MPDLGFYDILFEVSNEDRHGILLLLEDEPCNVTLISKKLGLSLPETSRQARARAHREYRRDILRLNDALGFLESPEAVPSPGIHAPYLA